MLALVCIVATPGAPAAAAPQPSGSDECSGCSLLGSLSVSLSSIEPAHPLVGDDVTFTFDLEYRLPGGVDCQFGDCHLDGGEPFLTGDDRPAPSPDGLVVRQHAVQAGLATVELHVSAMTEEQCFYLDPVSGCSYYFQSANISATSGPVQVEIGEPTPTPTPTATPTATPTRRSADDDGCAVAPAAARGTTRAMLVLLIPILLLRLTRRR